jgi:hypothetical protein
MKYMALHSCILAHYAAHSVLDRGLFLGKEEVVNNNRRTLETWLVLLKPL